MRLILRARRSLAGCSWNRGWVMPVVKVGSLPKQRSAMGQSRRALCWPFAEHCKTIEKARLNNVGTTGHLAWLHLLDQIWRHFLVRVGWSWMALSDSLSGKPLRDTWDVTTRVGDYKWSFYENRKTFFTRKRQCRQHVSPFVGQCDAFLFVKLITAKFNVTFLGILFQLLQTVGPSPYLRVKGLFFT